MHEDQPTSVQVQSQSQNDLPLAQEGLVRAREIVRSQIAMARHFPRDEHAAELRIIQSCQRYQFAALALYRYARGGSTIEGPSIRMAEAIATRWGNLDFGWQVVEQTEEITVLEAWCHDLESNNRKSLRWNVQNRKISKAGSRKLTDPRDIYENQANEGARRLRSCILSMIPIEVTQAAVSEVRAAVLAGEKNIPLAERVKRMLKAFQSISISKEMIEQKLGHTSDTINAEEIAELIGIFNSLRDNETKREDWFENTKPRSESKLAQLMNEKEDKNV